MNELRHFKEKNNKLTEELQKRNAANQEVINANASLKQTLRNIKSKRSSMGGAMNDDVPLEIDNNKKNQGLHQSMDSSGQVGLSPNNARQLVNNPHKQTINELEKQIDCLKKGKDALVQKHLNYKVKSDRMIEKLSNSNTTANSKI